MNTAINRVDTGDAASGGSDAGADSTGSGPKLVAISSVQVVPSATVPTSPAPTTKARTMLDLKVDQAGENIKSYLAEGDIINGDLEVRGGARVDGHVRGSLICRDGSAVISETGVVDGSVTATKRVIVGGRVGQGEKAPSSCVECPGDVVVLGKGVIECTVTYGNICTYDDGQINGKIARYVPR